MAKAEIPVKNPKVTVINGLLNVIICSSPGQGYWKFCRNCTGVHPTPIEPSAGGIVAYWHWPKTARWEVDLTLMSSVKSIPPLPSPSGTFYEVLPRSTGDFHCRGRGLEGCGGGLADAHRPFENVTDWPTGIRNQEAGITSWYLDPTRAAAGRLAASAWKLVAALTDRNTFAVLFVKFPRGVRALLAKTHVCAGKAESRPAARKFWTLVRMTGFDRVQFFFWVSFMY